MVINDILGNYFDKELGLQYTQSEILDRMMELYITIVMMNQNILSELGSNAEMLSVLHEG